METTPTPWTNLFYLAQEIRNVWNETLLPNMCDIFIFENNHILPIKKDIRKNNERPSYLEMVST